MRTKKQLQAAIGTRGHEVEQQKLQKEEHNIVRFHRLKSRINEPMLWIEVSGREFEKGFWGCFCCSLYENNQAPHFRYVGCVKLHIL